MYVIAVTPLEPDQVVHRVFVKKDQQVDTTTQINDAMEFDGPALAAQYLAAEMPALLALFYFAPAFTLAPKRMYQV